MVGLVEITAAVTGVKAGLDALTSAKDVYEKFQATNDEQDVQALKSIITKLAEDLFKARWAALEAQNTLQELQVAALTEDEFKLKKGEYAVTKTEAGGSIFTLQNSDKKDLHERVCPICVEKDKLFIPLQEKGINLWCGSCDGKFPNTRRKAAQKTAGGMW